MKATSNGDSVGERGQGECRGGASRDEAPGCGGGGQLEKLVADSRAWRDLGRGNDKHKCPGPWTHWLLPESLWRPTDPAPVSPARVGAE